MWDGLSGADPGYFFGQREGEGGGNTCELSSPILLTTPPPPTNNSNKLTFYRNKLTLTTTNKLAYKHLETIHNTGEPHYKDVGV